MQRLIRRVSAAEDGSAQPQQQSSTYLALTGQLSEEATSVSPRLAEFCCYYSNRMSYAEVGALVERMTGRSLLSDQSIQRLVIAKAASVSEKWAKEVVVLKEQATAAPPLPPVQEEVDFYDAQAAEVLVMADAIQVRRQKPTRDKNTNHQEAKQQKRSRVNTDIWLVEQAQGDGSFEAITAGIDESGAEVLSVEEQLRQRLRSEYDKHWQEPLPIVAIADGARTIRCSLESIFGCSVPIILDWYHLKKKVGEFMSMVSKNKVEKERDTQVLVEQLWGGQVEEAIGYLREGVQARNEEKKEALVDYLNKHRSEIIDYERRKRAGKSLGSGRVEKGVDQAIGKRQKKKGMSWSEEGSKALGILKVVEMNGRWEELWFPKQVAA